jgi:hypothetical protein
MSCAPVYAHESLGTKDPALLRTQFAIRQQDLAATFNAAMSKTRIGPGDYAPELTAPEGPSTGGGVQALQRLRLVPRAQGFPTLVVGSVNQNDGTAELRSFDHVDVLHRERFKRGVALDRAQYETFVGMAQNFLGVMRLRVSVAGPPIPSSPPPAAPVQLRTTPSAGGANYVVFIVLGVVALFVLFGAAAVAYWWLRMRR